MSDNNRGEYKVKVNEFEFNFTQEQVDAIDLIQNPNGESNLILHHESINAVLIKADLSGKRQIIEIDGQSFDIQIKDELDQMLDKMGFSAVVSKQIKEVKAPMPGLVLEVNVTEGQIVKEGDKILILVAMKMENSILIHADATIKKILVKAGQPVDKGQVLVELDGV